MMRPSFQQNLLIPDKVSIFVIPQQCSENESNLRKLASITRPEFFEEKLLWKHFSNSADNYLSENSKDRVSNSYLRTFEKWDYQYSTSKSRNHKSNHQSTTWKGFNFFQQIHLQLYVSMKGEFSHFLWKFLCRSICGDIRVSES